MTVRILTGDCRNMLATLAPGSVNCCVTSPPYYGLRDYGHAGQIGLEPTPDEFVAAMVDVFGHVRRVLADNGTLWLNLGDSYCSTDKWGGGGNVGKNTVSADGSVPSRESTRRKRPAMPGIKPKDLIGIPWRVAFALQADGWWLRSAIIWHKPNPMPESVTDRPTSAYEMVFLLAKSERYFYDAAAISVQSSNDGARPQRQRAEEIARQRGLTPNHLAAIRAVGVTDAGKARVTQSGTGKNDPAVQLLADEAKAALGGYYREFLIAETKNARNVWTIATQPFSDAHFATMAPELAEQCIKAGCPFGGTVLDPFGGAGTTGLVADRLQRNAVLVELNPEYAAMARRRIEAEAGMFSSVIEAAE